MIFLSINWQRHINSSRLKQKPYNLNSRFRKKTVKCVWNSPRVPYQFYNCKLTGIINLRIKLPIFGLYHILILTVLISCHL